MQFIIVFFIFLCTDATEPSARVQLAIYRLWLCHRRKCTLLKQKLIRFYYTAANAEPAANKAN